MSITYYVAVPFFRNEEGELIAGEGIELRSAELAVARARSMVGNVAGAIAFARSGDPATGEFRPGEILARFGETPDMLE